jgi:hypothetical protein
MEKKGFFFIIVAFVLLSYILASTYVWVRAIEMEEARYSEAFRVSSMELLFSQITGGRISEFTNISGHYALYRLNHHSISHPVSVPSGVNLASEEQLDGSELENVRLAMRELILYGTASGDYFEDGEAIEYTPEEKLIYSMEGWKAQLNGSLLASGFNLTRFEIEESDFSFTQSGYMEFNISFILHMEIRDARAGSATTLARDYGVNVEMAEEGMVDAYIARESTRQLGISDTEHPTVGKRIFIAPYYEDGYEALCAGDSDNPCYHIADSREGQGWFYGPAVMASDADSINPATTYNYILAGTYEEVTSVENWKDFGAYILTSSPEEGPECGEQFDALNALEYEEDCSDASINPVYEETEHPFIVYPGFDADYFNAEDLGYDQFTGALMPKVLFVSPHSFEEVEAEPELKLDNGAVYNIEGLRDFVLCGYYMPRFDSPSFLHRMFDLQDIFEGSDPAYYNWPQNEWGIETTAAGRWAGGDLVSQSWDEHSRVDTEFFLDTRDTVDGEAEKIKGMHGCKNSIICSMVFGSDIEHVGHFRLSDWARWDRIPSLDEPEPPSEEIYYIDTDSEEAGSDNIGCDNSGQASCEEN